MTEQKQENKPIFQALGIIRGDVDFDGDGKASVIVHGRQYSLKRALNRRSAFARLQSEIETSGSKNMRLLVYPNAMHFPQKDKHHIISFSLVGVGFGAGVSNQLDDFEFYLSGLWQYIPVCNIPCVSVMRNFSSDRIEHIKTLDALQKTRFMKASHLPLFWKDAPVNPFRYNPKSEEQSDRYFVQVKANFLPSRDAFAFESLASLPTKEAPRYLKASKAVKAEAQKIVAA